MYFQTIDFLSRLPLFGVVFQSLLPVAITAVMSGNDGQFTIAGVEQAVRSWTVNQEAGERETTNATDAATERSFVTDRAGASWTAEVFSDTAAAETLPATTVALVFIAKQGTADKKWAFSGTVNSANIVCNIGDGDAVLISYSGRADGAVTRTQFSA